MAISKTKKCLKIVLLTAISLLLTSILVFMIYFLSIYFSVDLDTDSIKNTTVKLTVLDRDNQDIKIDAILNDDVKIEEVSDSVIDAFIATEDKRFYEHKGVDFVRIGGAMLSNIKSGYLKEGGSTITQQLIKNTQIGDEKTFSRKIKELRLATQMEKEFSKDEILEMYLNNIYFGSGIYGIKSASMRMFSKSPIDLTVEESAVLAGIVKNPLKNSPLNSIENAKERRNIVLSLMYKNGKIDEETCKTLQLSPIILNETKSDDNYLKPYIKEVLNEAGDILNISPNDLLKSDVIIKTYLDTSMQNAVAKSCKNVEVFAKDGTEVNKYVITTDNKTCGISSYYCDFSMSISTMRRQVGSTIKPFLSYLPSIEYMGIAPISRVLDEKDSFSGYSPNNSGGVYRGMISFCDAVAYSSNVVPVSLSNDIGLERCKDFARNCGLTFDDGDTTLPIVLGGMQYGLTGIELVGAYMTIANGGQYARPAFVAEISQNSKTLYQNQTVKKQVFSKETAYLMTQSLLGTTRYGTANSLKDTGIVAAKTGTVGNSSGNKDSLCASYTADYTMVAHCLNYSSQADADFDVQYTGGKIASLLSLPILKSTSNTSEFAKPQGIVTLDIDTQSLKKDGTLLLCSQNTPAEYRQPAIFNERFAPTVVTREYDVMPLQSFSVNTSYNNVNIEFLADDDYTYYILYEGQIIKELHDFGGIFKHGEQIFDGGYYEFEVVSSNKYGVTSSTKKGVYATPFVGDSTWEIPDYFFSDQLE